MIVVSPTAHRKRTGGLKYQLVIFVNAVNASRNNSHTVATARTRFMILKHPF